MLEAVRKWSAAVLLLAAFSQPGTAWVTLSHVAQEHVGVHDHHDHAGDHTDRTPQAEHGDEHGHDLAASTAPVPSALVGSVLPLLPLLPVHPLDFGCPVRVAEVFVGHSPPDDDLPTLKRRPILLI